MIPLYIFDLDGTLADCEHRKHFVTQGNHHWSAFYAACEGDAPMQAVIDTMEWLLCAQAEVWIWSGRSDEVREKTENWLSDHTEFTYGEMRCHGLKMRPAGDYTPDEELKEKWLNEMSAKDRARLVGVFDDRDKVVAMWRKNGVTCFQVAPGSF